MSTAVQRRRGTTAQHVNFTGLPAELTVDTSKNVVVVHDGVTPGGHALAPETHEHTVAQISDASTIGKVILTAANAGVIATALGLGSAAYASTGDFAAPIHSHPLAQLQQSGAATGQVATWDGAEWAPLNPASADPTHAQVLAALGYTPAGLAGPSFSGLVTMARTDGNTGLLVAGATKGVRFYSDTVGTSIEGVDNTGSASYQPLRVGGSYVAFTVAGSEKMRMDANGRLGIGTSSPGYQLDVYDSQNATTGARIWNNNAGASAVAQLQFATGTPNAYMSHVLADQGGTPIYRMLAGAGVGYIYTDFDTQIWRNRSSVERMRLDSNGYLGIGTNAPSSNLDVLGAIRNRGGSGNGYVQLTPGDTTHTGYASFMAHDDTRIGYIGYGNVTGLAFLTDGATPTILGCNGTEKARLSSNGNLLVGTTVDSGHRLHVGGSVGISDGVNAKLAIYSDGANTVTIEAFDQSNTAKKLIALAPYGGRVLIGGAADTGALLAVNGVIESTSGGVKFPDATTQTTAVVAGTGANQALQIGADGKLPAIDGSKLTGIVAGGKAANFQEFNSSGTWTKPSGYGANALVKVQLWGGGGGGGKGYANCSGGGGGYNEAWFKLSQLGATETVTVGAGGVAATVNGNAGGAGGNSTFGAWLAAYGGGGGFTYAALGGGYLSAPTGGFTQGSPGKPLVSAGFLETDGAGNSLGTIALHGSIGQVGGGYQTYTSWWHGGACGNPNSVYGGAAGGTATTGAAGPGGTSVFGGNGGTHTGYNGGLGNAGAGQQPGGGGGGTYNAAYLAGNGGAGRVRVTVFDAA